MENIADRVLVMYLGRVVELAPRAALFDRPSHPYTQALLAALPRLGRGKRKPGSAPKGEVANPLSPPSRLPLPSPRCPKAQALCAKIEPLLEAKPEATPGRRVALPFSGLRVPLKMDVVFSMHCPPATVIPAQAGIHMWTAPCLQEISDGLIGSLAAICPAC